MQRAVSTHLFLSQHLHPGHLDALQKGGAEAIEIFAARHHFDYTDRSAIRELALWFRSSPVKPTLHQPLHDRSEWSRDISRNVNLLDPEKGRRINAMDEVKRSIEAAEMIPFESIVLHLGDKSDKWSQRALEYSLTAIEHLKAFAHPLGVKVLLENLDNEVTSPDHLMEILRVGHFDTVNVCLDLGHANLSDGGLDEAFSALGPRVREVHLHDNHGTRDEHCWPGDGNIDWKHAAELIQALPTQPIGVLEISNDLQETLESAPTKAAKAFSLLQA